MPAWMRAPRSIRWLHHSAGGSQRTARRDQYRQALTFRARYRAWTPPTRCWWTQARRDPSCRSTRASRRWFRQHQRWVVAGVPVAELSTQDARDQAYRQLAANPAWCPTSGDPCEQAAALANHVFVEVYDEPDAAITARLKALSQISTTVGLYQAAIWRWTGCRLRRSTFLPPSVLPSPSG
jgi:hypothetical protein